MPVRFGGAAVRIEHVAPLEAQIAECEVRAVDALLRSLNPLENAVTPGDVGILKDEVRHDGAHDVVALRDARVDLDRVALISGAKVAVVDVQMVHRAAVRGAARGAQVDRRAEVVVLHRRTCREVNVTKRDHLTRQDPDTAAVDALPPGAREGHVLHQKAVGVEQHHAALLRRAVRREQVDREVAQRAAEEPRVDRLAHEAEARRVRIVPVLCGEAERGLIRDVLGIEVQHGLQGTVTADLLTEVERRPAAIDRHSLLHGIHPLRNVHVPGAILIVRAFLYGLRRVDGALDGGRPVGARHQRREPPDIDRTRKYPLPVSDHGRSAIRGERAHERDPFVVERGRDRAAIPRKEPTAAVALRRRAEGHGEARCRTPRVRADLQVRRLIDP